jgi:geranylgeranyl reductase family protein
MTGATVNSTSIIDDVEVVVVGAGPAGSCCAARLAELGHEVLLLDKNAFPRDKPCGDGLTGVSVQVLEQFELNDLLRDSSDVLGFQTYSGSEYKLTLFQRSARCISRFALDQSLLSAALERGVRFKQMHVDGLLTDGRTVFGVSSAGTNGGGILARCVIAADGATSRLRKECGFSPVAPERRAYAVRQYVRSERPLPPYFDIHIPLLHHSAELLGYGWVFPLDEYTANVGIGFYRNHLTEAQPSLRTVLSDFTEKLERDKGGWYGALKPTGSPLGSPIGIGFRAQCCQFQRVLFVGDAARMTEPITGEGIGHALHGGLVVAETTHAVLSSSRGSDWHKDLDLGSELAHRFLRLGQDVDVLRRIAAPRAATAGDHPRMRRTKARDKPFLSATARAVTQPYEQPTLDETPIYSLVAQHDRKSTAALDALNERVLEEIRTPLPFVPETLYLRLRAGTGPVPGALVLLTARTGGRNLDSITLSAALGTEFLAMFPDLLNQAVDRPVGRTAKLNNVFTILVADYAVSRALKCSAPAGTAITHALAHTGCSMCEAEMIARVGGDDLRMATACYLRAAQLREGKLFELAMIVGGILAGQPAGTMTALRSYGRSLGMAFRISRDICHLLTTEEPIREQTERTLHDGYLSLPIIEALVHDGTESGALPADLAAAVSMAHRHGGFDKALLECERMARKATDAVDGVDLNAAITTLIDLPMDQARSAVRALDNAPSATAG